MDSSKFFSFRHLFVLLGLVLDTAIYRTEWSVSFSFSRSDLAFVFNDSTVFFDSDRISSRDTFIGLRASRDVAMRI
jgi:hypothetical protein